MYGVVPTEQKDVLLFIVPEGMPSALPSGSPYGTMESTFLNLMTFPLRTSQHCAFRKLFHKIFELLQKINEVVQKINAH